MGTIKKLKENNLVDGVGEEDVYPITSTRAVFNDQNENVDEIIKRQISSNSISRIDIKSLSDLDSYTPYDKIGTYNVYRYSYLGVLYVLPTLVPGAGGTQLFITTLQYNENGNGGSLGAPSIIFRVYNYRDRTWGEWKPYQTTFITDDGNIPSYGGNVGFDETNISPSLRYINERTAYPKILKWSGTIIENGVIQPGNASTSSYNNIKFIKNKGCFAYDDRGKLYRSWYGAIDFQTSEELTRNIFIDRFGNIWVANSVNTIKQINTDAPIDGKTYGRSNGQWTEVSSSNLSSIQIAEWSGNIDTTSSIHILENTSNEYGELNDTSQIVFHSTIKSFLYKNPQNEGYYYNNWVGFEKYQSNFYHIEESAEEFNPGLKSNIFKGIDGSYWIANSQNSIQLIGNTLDIIDGEYDPSSPSNFQPVADKILASPNFMARIQYKLYETSSSSSYDLVFFKGSLSKTYEFSTVFPLALVGTSASGKTYLMMRYDKQIEIIQQTKNEIYQLPGDITTMGNSFDLDIIGSLDALKYAIKSGNIIVSSGVVLQCTYDSLSDTITIVAVYSLYNSQDIIKEFWGYSEGKVVQYKKFKIIGTEV